MSLPPPPASEGADDLILESPLTRAFLDRLSVQPIRNTRSEPILTQFLPAKNILFVVPDGYEGRPQDLITQQLTMISSFTP